MRFNIEITARAEVEIEQAYRWIYQDAPSRAAAWRRKLLERTDSLNSFPERCPLAPEAATFGQEIHQLLFGVYRILFIIQGDTIYVLHVRHGARRHLEPTEDKGVDGQP